MKFFQNLEQRILGDVEPINQPIITAKIAQPTIAALATTITLSALATGVSNYVTDNKIINTVVSHGVEIVSQTLTFTLYYMVFNKERYTIKEKYNVKAAVYDLLFKVLPAGGISGILIDLFIRDPVNYSVMQFLKIHPIISTAVTQTCLAIPQYFARMSLLVAGSSYANKTTLAK